MTEEADMANFEKLEDASDCESDVEEIERNKEGIYHDMEKTEKDDA